MTVNMEGEWLNCPLRGNKQVQGVAHTGFCKSLRLFPGDGYRDEDAATLDEEINRNAVGCQNNVLFWKLRRYFQEQDINL
jgi:hypothetical protein